mmetsp:Transcript_6620/g.24740  ORF Transcript_6620/g.24740 Transcript_6620/m.24740 type:complete len:533 (-) Transcript_6620:1210-2808(-)|eukprot:CAMPEP_0117443322 /NCGR_PEP_ID=MMETSP0759-20121206/4632_1 /TAXON_ID=63605 /ORGANISM="Percolomonas cosmopolitus, Strain WS" /LENGTH=532 /DNA_ID=CAMNT_0005235287 /DNA_START=270 /DNA_END=1868 /DNA_ORIENTATION=+
MSQQHRNNQQHVQLHSVTTAVSELRILNRERQNATHQQNHRARATSLHKQLDRPRSLQYGEFRTITAANEHIIPPSSNYQHHHHASNSSHQLGGMNAGGSISPSTATIHSPQTTLPSKFVVEETGGQKELIHQFPNTVSLVPLSHSINQEPDNNDPRTSPDDLSPLSPPAISLPNGGVHPLILACSTNNLEAVRHIASKELSLGREFLPDVPRHKDTGYTPLMCAVAVGSLQIVKLLVSHGANANFVTDHSMSRWSVLMKGADLGFLEIVRFLVEEGGARLRHVNKHGESSLTRAALSGHVEVVRYLLSKRANVNLADELGSCPLHWASLHGHLSVVSLLLDFGANPNHTDNNLETPLMFAVGNHHPSTVRVLLEKGKANPNMCNKNGESPLMEAATKGYADLVDVLIEYGADVHHRNKDYVSSLDKASQAGHLQVVKILVSNGARVRQDNAPSAIRYAQNFPDVVAFLEGASIMQQQQDDLSSIAMQSHQQQWSTQQQIAMEQLQKDNERLQSQLHEIQKQGHNETIRNSS